MPTWLVLLLTTLAVDRAQRVVTGDELTEGLRRAAARRWPTHVEPLHDYDGAPLPGTGAVVASWQVKLLNCGRCLSFWLSGVAVGLLAVAGVLHLPGPLDVLAWWAVAGAASILAGLVP